MPKKTRKNFKQILKANTKVIKEDFQGIYKMKKLILSCVLLLSFAQIISAQVIETPIPPVPGIPALAKAEQKVEISAENKKRAIELLRETSQMINTLASPNNRIGYSIRTGKILWKLDEKSARETYRAAMNDVRQTVLQTDLEMNRIENATTTDSSALVAANEIYMKINQVFTLRSSLVNSLAEDDPEWAFEFLQDTRRSVTSQYLRKNLDSNDAYIESSLIGRIAEKNSAKALTLGYKKLAKGISSETVSLMQSLYSKDSDKGAAFAEDVLKKIKEKGLSTESSWVLMSLFEAGIVNNEESIKQSETPDKKPLFSESSLREIADLFAKQVVDPLNVESFGLGEDMLASLQKYAPQKSAQLKKLMDLQKAREERDKSSEQPESKFDSAMQKLSETQSSFQSEITKKVEGLNAQNISSEDKKKIIEEARSKILTNNKTTQLSNLISLSAQAAAAGEKEVAVSLLDEAEQLTKPQTQEMKDFTEKWTLAKGYVNLKPEKSFAMVEDTIFRLNDVIAAYIKFSEFQSGEMMIENGELKMTDYGGHMFGFFSSTGELVGKLVEADYSRTKAFADKFDRSEFKVETRLMIANILVKPKSPYSIIMTQIRK